MKYKLPAVAGVFSAVIAFSPQNVNAWDYEGHRVVNELALASLPPGYGGLDLTPALKERIIFLAGEPDRWRNVSDLPAEISMARIITLMWRICRSTDSRRKHCPSCVMILWPTLRGRAQPILKSFQQSTRPGMPITPAGCGRVSAVGDHGVLWEAKIGFQQPQGVSNARRHGGGNCERPGSSPTF